MLPETTGEKEIFARKTDTNQQYSSNFTSNKGLHFFCQFIELNWPKASMVLDKFNDVDPCLPEITNFSLSLYCVFALNVFRFFAT